MKCSELREVSPSPLSPPVKGGEVFPSLLAGEFGLEGNRAPESYLFDRISIRSVPVPRDFQKSGVRVALLDTEPSVSFIGKPFAGESFFDQR